MTVRAVADVLRDAAGAAVVLGEQLGQGGEGTVYAVDGDPGSVAKLYAEPPSAEQVAKLAAMIATGDEELARVAAWPTGLVFDGDVAAGFLMPKLASQLPLHELFGPRRRQTLFPDAHWTFLVHAGLNVARAFEAMHERAIVVGDVNSNNVVIHRNSKTRFIDCDSFQIRRDGVLYRCNVGVPEYQPPELQGVDLGVAERLPQHDRFGLAVMIFQLLFVGKHPFAGILPPHLAADSSIGANVAAGHFFYGPEAAALGLRPPPGSLALTAMPDVVETLFLRAFLGDPADRPSATAWREALRELERDAVTCERTRRHRYVRGNACPWCELERSGLYYFAPKPDERVPLDDSPWVRFPDAEVERIWSEIAAIPAPPMVRDPVGQRPTDRWATLRRARGTLTQSLGSPAARQAARAAAADRRMRVETARATFAASYSRWRELSSNRGFLAERERLAALRTRLLGQRAQRDAELAIARAAQVQLDRATYLMQFPIPRVPQVQGSLITPSGPTTGIDNRSMRDLARYGITTAAHITAASLRAVPHLRSWRYDVLMEWRASLDARFDALPVRELDLRTQRDIDARYARDRDTAATELASGAVRLRDLADAIARERDELAQRLPLEAAALWAAQREAGIS